MGCKQDTSWKGWVLNFGKEEEEVHFEALLDSVAVVMIQMEFECYFEALAVVTEAEQEEEVAAAVAAVIAVNSDHFECFQNFEELVKLELNLQDLFLRSLLGIAIQAWQRVKAALHNGMGNFAYPTEIPSHPTVKWDGMGTGQVISKKKSHH